MDSTYAELTVVFMCKAFDPHCLVFGRRLQAASQRAGSIHISVKKSDGQTAELKGLRTLHGSAVVRLCV